MNITVKLQSPFSYSIWPVILLGIVVLGPIVFLLLRAIFNWLSRRKKKNKAVKEMKEQIQQVVVLHPDEIKKKYIALLQNIRYRRTNGEIENRLAHQELSTTVRKFVKEMTGINVQNYTLSEIKGLKMPQLYYIIDECYTPEFATDDEENVAEAVDVIDKAKKVISEWN